MTKLQQRIDESKQVFEKIQSILALKSFDLDDRKTVGMGCLSSSLEYHAAVHLLCGNKRYGAAVALLRPQFEAYTKGVWFINCSTDIQVNKAYEDKFDKKFNKIISGIEHKKVPGWEDIKEIEKSYWSLLCGFTHTGQPQLARRFNGQNITPNYHPHYIASALNLADTVAFKVLMEVLGTFKIEVEPKTIVDLLSTTGVLNMYLEPAYNKSKAAHATSCAGV